jgi:hypothetical protein
MHRNDTPGLKTAALAACLLLLAGLAPAPAAAANANHDTDGWLGVVLMAKETAHKEDRGDDTRSRELRILEVMDDSPAEAAGLEDGDLIVAVDGREIGELDSFVDLVADRAPGSTMELTIERDGLRQNRLVTLGERPEDMIKAHKLARKFKFLGPGGHHAWVFGGGGAKVRIGIGLQGLTDGLREHFGAPADEGVLISEVFEDSPAQDAGLKAGDVVLAINGQSVASHGDLVRGLKELEPGDTARLHILRNHAEMTVDVTVEAKPHAMNLGCCEDDDEDCCGHGLIWKDDEGGTFELGNLKLGENTIFLDGEDLEDLDIRLEGLGEDIEQRVHDALEGLQGLDHNVFVTSEDDGDCVIRIEEVTTDGDQRTREVHMQCRPGEGQQREDVRKPKPAVSTPDDLF